MQKIIATVGGLLLTAIPANASSMLTSWYGPGFHGRTTANGETYNQYGYTAAHKSLPFGTRLRVCYQKCVEVRINDRGPFITKHTQPVSYTHLTLPTICSV